MGVQQQNGHIRCTSCGGSTGAHAGMVPVMPGYCRPVSNCTPADAEPSRDVVSSAVKATAARSVCAMLRAVLHERHACTRISAAKARAAVIMLRDCL